MSAYNPYQGQQYGMVPSVNQGQGVPVVSCPACTFNNRIDATRCQVCQTPLDAINIGGRPMPMGSPPPYGSAAGTPIVPSQPQGVVYIDANTGQQVFVPAGQNVVVVDQSRSNRDADDACLCCAAIAALLACCCIAEASV